MICGSIHNLLTLWTDLINPLQQMPNLSQNALEGGSPIPDVSDHLNLDTKSSSLFDLLMDLISDECLAGCDFKIYALHSSQLAC